MPENQTNIVISPPKQEPQHMPSLTNSNLIPQMSSEGYKLIDRLVDPNALYLDKLTTFLYGAHLTKTTIYDPDSPVPGYRLDKIGGKGGWHPNMNKDGYSTTTAEVLMSLAEDGSVTRFPDDFKLAFFCARQTMAIVAMMSANREEWEFTNYSIIYPFGLTMWKAMVATLSRSRAEPGRTTLMDKLVHPNLWLTQQNQDTQTAKNKWFNI